MRKILLSSCFVGIMAGTCTNSVAEGLAVAPKIGITGPGVDLVAKLTPKLNTRIGFNILPYDTNQEEEGIDYEVDLKISALTVLLDYHPFANNFRVSGGLINNYSSVDFKASGQDDYTIDDTTYRGNLTLKGDLSFRPVSPYLGVGWGNAVKEGKGLGFAVELGIVIQGEPQFDLEASGIAQELDGSGNPIGVPFEVATNSEFLSELERETANVRDDLKDFSIFPVLNIGLSYQF